MSNATTTDVTVAGEFAALAEMVRELFTVTEPVDGETADADEFVMGVMDKILSATTFDEIFDAQETSMISGKDFVDRPFYVERSNDIVWRRSSQSNIDQGGFPYYALITLTTLDTQETLTINCGGKTLCAVLYSLWKRGYFEGDEPRPLYIKAIKATGDNAYLQLLPYKVVAPPAKKK